MNFDPAAYLDMPMDAPLIKRPPVKVGDYVSIIKEVIVRPWQSKDKTNEDGSLKSGIAYDVIHTVEIPEEERVRTGLQNTSLELKRDFILDLLPSGGLDGAPGKNGWLRRYRDATDLNQPGVTFRASQLVGKMVTVKIGHREYQGDLYEEITGVAKLG